MSIDIRIRDPKNEGRSYDRHRKHRGDNGLGKQENISAKETTTRSTETINPTDFRFELTIFRYRVTKR